MTDEGVTDAIARELEGFLRRAFHIRADDPAFTPEANLWSEGYIDSVGVVETIAHLEARWQVKLPEQVVFDARFTHVAGIADLVAGLLRGAAT